MNKKILRKTISQREIEGPLNAQPARDTAALLIPITAIRVSENVRTDLGDLSELTESVKAHGILQALLVRKANGGLELIAGHRRLEASRRAGLIDVPVRVVNANEGETAILRLVENLQRQDLSGPEEIMAVAKLAGIFPDQVRLAAAIGKSKTYVSRCLKASQLLRDPSCAGATAGLSKSALFELAGSENPAEVSKQLTSKTKQAVRDAKGSRTPSGPIPGGHAVDRVIRYNERRGGQGFTLKVHFDFDKSTEGDRERLLNQLYAIIKQLEIKNGK